ncbi:PrgI family protein [Varibaculum cambriense]|uniref:PrgI family protein n=1 Tax=Varibaculum cambriense TaxID=184870 RepID=UPI0025548FF4|nr:PrgI family protein [Varibaculum cambriense]MDK8275413.1 PrgI family protein [Varibaculum cambriense]
MSLQISVPKEIKEYKQVVAFGLTLKQLLWCGAGVLTGAGVFFLIKDKVALDIVAIICMLSAIPFALMGFVNYNGMDAWELFVQWFKVTFLMRPLKYESTNYYKDLLLSSNEEFIDKFQFKEREAEPKLDQVENPINSKPPKKPRILEIIKRYKFLILVFVLILSFIALGLINKLNKPQEENTEQTSTTTTQVTTTTTVAPTTTSQKPVGVIPIPENSKGKATTTLIENKTTTTTTVAPTTTTVAPATTTTTTRATQVPITTTPKVIQNTSQTKVRETVKTENNEVFDPIIETLPPKN